MDPTKKQHQRNNNPPNGKVQARRAGQVKSKVKSMLNILFTPRGLFIKISSWQAKQSIPHTAVMFYGDCMKICEDFAPKTRLLHHDNTASHTSFFTGNFSPKAT
jgi:hypothetical protein